MAETITYTSEASKGGRVSLRVEVAYTNVGTSQETEIQFPSAIAKNYWYLESFHIVRSGGTASNWAPRLGNSSGFSANSINELVGYDSGAVGTPIHDVWQGPGLPSWLGTNQKLYFAPAFDAGSDNDGSVEFIFSRD